MLNYSFFKKKISFLQARLQKKNFFLDIKKIKLLEKKRKNLQVASEKLQANHKKLTKYSTNYLKKIYKKIDFFKKKLIFSKKETLYAKKKLISCQEKIDSFLINIPNIPDISVPNGNNYLENKIISTWGKKKKYNFKIKNHVQLGEKIDGFDWKSASKISGSGFVIMKGNLAKLHRTLGQFMLDTHINMHGYQEIYIPNLVKEDCVYGTGQLPKFEQELFFSYKGLIEKRKYYLIPTAEVPLTNLFKNSIISEDCLPIKITALSSCFRAESNTYGKNCIGLIRNHQFEKVEIVQITTPKNSMQALEEITQHAEKILQLLCLPYRKVLLCSGDLGFSAAKTYDLEVWFPSINNYKEISSCSIMTDFQSRRIKARYKDKKLKKNFFLHTLNGSGLAIGRTIAAILENYQQRDGNIEIPKVLQKLYMNGKKFLM